MHRRVVVNNITYVKIFCKNSYLLILLANVMDFVPKKKSGGGVWGDFSRPIK